VVAVAVVMPIRQSCNHHPPPADPLIVAFSDISDASGIQFTYGYLSPVGSMVERFGGGVGSGDYDNDGDIDLFVVRGDSGPNLLYRNDGNNTFTDVAAAAGLDFTLSAGLNYRHSGPTFADMDGDGDLDLFLGGIHDDPSLLFANNGDGTFSDVTAGSGIDTMTATHTISAAFGDYDRDGDVDLALAHWGVPYASEITPGDTEHLWRNDSDATGIRFTSVSIAANISATVISPDPDGAVLTGIHDYSFAPTFADINGDQYADLLLVSDFGTTNYFENNQDGTFTNITKDGVVRVYSGMGSAVADYDNDGDLDWFVTAIHDEAAQNPDHGNALYKNDGSGTFSAVAEAAGVIDGDWGWGACFADFDNDGHLDIYHTNGWANLGGGAAFVDDPSRLFVSNGNGGFLERAAQSGIVDFEQGRGVVCADFDNDGDTDVFVTHREPSNAAFLYRNDADVNNYLKVDLRGTGSNTECSGARIEVTVGNMTQTRELHIGSNFISQNPTQEIFGLGTAAQADSVRILWPDGSEETHQSVAANQTVEYVH
jgi:hypothetical protein